MTDKPDGKRRWRLAAIVITANAVAAFVFFVFGMPGTEADISEIERRAYLIEMIALVSCAMANIAAILSMTRYRSAAMLLSVAANGVLIWRAVVWWSSDFATSGDLAPNMLSVAVIILVLISGYGTVTVDHDNRARRI